MSPYRSFPSDIEECSKHWAGKVLTEAEWVDLGPFGTSESKPFKVKSENNEGLAKPGVKKTDDVPRAAIEKITSDLAYHLELPVPPVILWDRGDDNLPERYVCISAWMYDQPMTWNEAKFSDDEASRFAPTLSAMLAFEEWISAQDRKQEHVIVNSASTNQIAFIDYAYSMYQVWKQDGGSGKPAKRFQPTSPNQSALADMARKIKGLDAATVNLLVNRIPASFLSDAQKRRIIQVLCARRQKIDTYLGLD